MSRDTLLTNRFQYFYKNLSNYVLSILAKFLFQFNLIFKNYNFLILWCKSSE